MLKESVNYAKGGWVRTWGTRGCYSYRLNKDGCTNFLSHFNSSFCSSETYLDHLDLKNIYINLEQISDLGFIIRQPVFCLVVTKLQKVYYYGIIYKIFVFFTCGLPDHRTEVRMFE